MHVAEIWRYPVKSLQGERLDAAMLGVEGVHGDRRFALFDVETGFGLTGRRVPELLFASARLVGSESVEIVLPDGTVAADDAALSAWLGRAVTLRSTAQVVERRFENVDDFEHEGSSGWHPFDGSRGAFQDSPSAAVSLVSTGTLGDWDRRRFRPNIVLSGSGEDALVDSVVAIGDALVDVRKHLGRCVMVTRPQPGGIEKDLAVLRAVHRERGGHLAIGGLVTREGLINVGDEVSTETGALAL